MLSDNGKEFDNKFVKGTVEEYGVLHVTTPPYHPQANTVERSNRTLKAMISAFVGADHRNWDQHVHEFRHAVNNFLNYGRHPQPCLSSVLTKDAGDWYEVYQDDMEFWDFATFERAFRHQFIGELHEDDVMEELRARYQGLKEKVAPYLTKFRRMIAHLKRPPAVREQINLAFSYLRPEYQDYLWDK